MNAVVVRGEWVGQVIDGRYPLLEWLGGSAACGVFLTELDGLGSQKAALKLLPSSPQSEDRLAGWVAASKLAHPHLARIHHFGRTDVSGNSCVYLVSDLAEELLSQIIPERSLTGDEARQMLDPILSALDYLHKAGYVHAHLKPSNVLVVENDIRLSSDALVAIGHPISDITNDLHNAPELATGPADPRSDIWSLGVTLVEALTQQLPIWDAAADAEPVVPGSIPAPFAEIARQCLQPEPERRCTVSGIRSLLEPPQKPVAARSTPAVPPPAATSAQSRIPDKPLPARMPFLPLVIGFLLLVAIIIGLRIHSRKATATAPLQPETAHQAPPRELESKPAQPETQEASRPAPQTVAPAPPAGTAHASSRPSSDGEVLTRDIPNVPQRASNTIHGTVSVAIRVDVDAGGAVSSAEYATRGPSAYFARIALESARKWKFKPPQQDGRAVPASWLLHYKFRRGGVDVTPIQTRR
ncbi:serine/threonine protein kinase [Occallatibacter savannae]|uniref:serine/threonine protein kinase n=1 Tax=Occallatibacter savannae TaxID=1002691 RepID=UPI000D688373|nr:TonB family protein [Occallatibacter savannae]